MYTRTAFSEGVVNAAWLRSGGRCECRRVSHGHPAIRCAQRLIYGLRGSELAGGWEAHHINSNGGDMLSNCEILCQQCHKKTQSYGG